MSIVNEQALIALIDSRIAAIVPQIVQQQPVQQFQQPVQQQPVQQPQVQQYQQPQHLQQAQPNVQGGQVTADMIQQVITPLLQNEASKQAVIQAMTACGVQNLTEARPDQLPALYAAFQQVAANFAGGGQQQYAQQQPVQQYQQPQMQQQPAAQQPMTII
jgi:hypothetical protein